MDSCLPLILGDEHLNEGGIDLEAVTLLTSPIILEEEVKELLPQSVLVLQEFPSLNEVIGSTCEFLLEINRTRRMCLPNFMITRLNSSSEYAELPSVACPERIKCTSGQGDICCTCWFTTSVRNISLFLNNTDTEQKLYFVDKSQPWFGLWCGKKEGRMVDIYLPFLNDRIGYIKFENDFKNGAEIFNCINTNEQLTAMQTEDRKVPTLSLKVVNSNGMEVASAESISGISSKCGSRGIFDKASRMSWTNFKLTINPEAITSIDTRAIILVTFIAWVITYQERSLREGISTFLFGLTLSIIFGLLFWFAYMWHFYY